MQKNAVIGKFGAALFTLALGLAVGCGGRQVVQSPIAEKSPDWVNKASGAFKDGGQAVFYGVGIAQGIRNRALAVTAADDRGRAELAKVMNSYVTVLTKDYMASTTAGSMDKSSEEQHVSTVMKNFAKFTLHGSMPVDHWKDPTDGTLFALVKLDMASVKKSLEESKELDSKVRDFVRANAEKAFDELAAAEGASR